MCTRPGSFKELSLADYKGKYLVFFFCPLDFAFVCPTEITAFSDRHADEHHYEERAAGSSLLGEEESQWTLEHDSGRRAFDELSCEPTSPLDGCLPCTADESTEQYCSVSGYRQEVRCISDNSTDSGREARGPFLAYHSCLQRESDLHGLARFEFLMVCLLGASLSVVRRRKRRLDRIQHDRIQQYLRD